VGERPVGEIPVGETSGKNGFEKKEKERKGGRDKKKVQWKDQKKGKNVVRE
jgi:hypothetical protein